MGQAVKKDAFMRNPRRNRKCVCEHLDFWWDEHELKELSVMWEQGFSIEHMAEYFNRKNPDEVLLALIDLAHKDKITQRKGGLMSGIFNAG